MTSIDSLGNIHRGAGGPGGGQFTGRVGVAPAVALSDQNFDGAGCDLCGVDDRIPGGRHCVDCASCARCDRSATGDDGLCDAHTARWGKVSTAIGSRTPWGPADSVTEIAPGMVAVSTATHGGVKLSPERNRLIPGPFRDQHGWYEEDSEVAIIHRYFADECADEVDDVQLLEARAEQALRDQFPSEWEQVNGRELNPGESVRKDRESWTVRHKNSFVSRAVEAAESNPGLVVVTALRAADGVEAQYLVPRAEYRAAQQWGERGSDRRMVIDPARHPMLPPLDATVESSPAPTLYKPTVPSGSALSQMYIDGDITATARDRIARDLARCWKQEDGTVLSLKELIQEKGVSARSAHQEGAAVKYQLLRPAPNGGHYVLPVSKATFDLLAVVPDDRSPAEVAGQTYSAYQERLDRKAGGAIPAEQARARELHRKYRTLADEEIAARSRHAVEDASRRLTQIERERAAVIVRPEGLPAPTR